MSEIACYYLKKGGYGKFVRGWVSSDLLYKKPVEPISNPDGDKAIRLD